MTAARGKRFALAALSGLLVFLFTGLGIWQVERRAWKLALIERVDERIHAAPVPIPPAPRWPSYDAGANAYRRVEARGTFRHDLETRVDALTERGPGDWLMTPLVTPAGTVLVNRGFVPDGNGAVRRPAGPVVVRGLLRPSEPKGRFLRPNAPAQQSWFSRDVAAIAAARHLGPVAPFFIDAKASPDTSGAPYGGMTVVRFRNAHLSYALTWFGLAILSMVGLVIVLRSPQKRG